MDFFFTNSVLTREFREKHLLRVLLCARHYIMCLTFITYIVITIASQSSCAVTAYFLLISQLWFRNVDQLTCDSIVKE